MIHCMVLRRVMVVGYQKHHQMQPLPLCASLVVGLACATACRRYRLLEIELDAVYRCMLLLKKKKYAAVKVSVLGWACSAGGSACHGRLVWSCS